MTKAKTAEQARRKKRKTRQRKPARYSKRREDAQLSGREPVSAEGAVRNERVSPLAQEDQPLPALVARGIRSGWATPEEMKPILVDEMVGIIQDPEMKAVPKIMAYQALLKGDQYQYERENPEAAGKAKGGVKVDVNQQVVVTDPYQLYKRALEESLVDPVELRIEQELQGGKDGFDGVAGEGVSDEQQRDAGLPEPTPGP